MAEYGENHAACEVPPADTLIVNWFHQVGRCSSNGMGLTAITFSELSAFNSILKIDLTPWESEQLIMMSRDYTATLTQAKDPLMSAPWHSEYYDELQAARDRVVINGKKLAKVRNKKYQK